jgi:hypothetical protein
VGDPFDVLQAALAARYRLERQVGQGGMGVVYLAHDLKHDREVAIKVLRPGVAALLGRERFLREIGIAAQLTHPHIVPLFDSGEAAGHLYYVMPYVTGETLAERLHREHRLPMEEATRITGQVATALVYAHERGVVHRDIKPSNILLSGGFALVADFGLARALSRVDDGSDISSIGLPIGTPRYMSPEQAMGSPSVDGRSDLYSLGCVLYEMLVGSAPRDTPAEGKSESGGWQGPPTPRQAVPPEVAGVLARCLAPNPANRYATAQELIAGLGQPVLPVPARRGLAVGAIAMASVVVWALSRTGSGGAGTGLDTTRFVVLPFDVQPGAPAFQADLQVRGALARWSGISVVGGVETSEALKSVGAPALDRRSASLIAQRLGAGRIVRGQVVPFGDSVQVEAVIYDTRDRSALVEKNVRLPLSLAGADSVLPRLIDLLLFRGTIPAENFASPAGTTSVPAMWEFIRGHNAVNQWDLATADSAFGRAFSLDPAFARAALWLAQVRVWQGQPAVTWRMPAEKAVSGGARLGSRDTALARAIALMSRGEYGAACPRWLELTHLWPGEFPVWYGAANCLSRDRGVERDPRSPTHWRFRSSYQQAQRAWRQAFGLMPAIYRDYRAGGLRSAQWLLWTASNRGRQGVAVPPDTGFFASYPTLEGDTLAFHPRPMSDFTSGRAIRPAATLEAVTRERIAFFDLATEWVAADPRNLEAREAVALALWSLGNSTAIDSIRATRALARTAADRVRLGVSEVLMRILTGIAQPAELMAARGIADSALASDSSGSGIDPWDLATLAALTGRATLAARFVRLASPRTAWALPAALTGDALAFLSFAALGGPGDSLVALERRVVEGIASGVEAGGQGGARREWLGRPLALVALDVSLPSFTELTGAGDYLLDAEAAQLRGDTAEARRGLERTAASRAGTRPSDMTFEALLPEARVFSAMGDVKTAIGRLDPILLDLRHASLQIVSHPVGAALLVRAMGFRAELASAAGDSVNARKWGQAVRILWSEADPFLAPVVQRMLRPGVKATP